MYESRYKFPPLCYSAAAFKKAIAQGMAKHISHPVASPRPAIKIFNFTSFSSGSAEIDTPSPNSIYDGEGGQQDNHSRDCTKGVLGNNHDFPPAHCWRIFDIMRMNSHHTTSGGGDWLSPGASEDLSDTLLRKPNNCYYLTPAYVFFQAK